MKLEVFTLQNQKVSDIDLNETIFGAKFRKDILQRVVEWQRARKQAGTHQTKMISEISGTTKKPFKQKVLARHVKVACVLRI